MPKRAVPTLLLVIGLVLGACGGGSGQESTRPSATASPDPTPSASPVDVASEFAAQMQASTQLDAELSGTLEVGGRTGDLSGSLQTDGDDAHQLIVVSFPELAPRETEAILVGTAQYDLVDGTWIRTTLEPASGEARGFQGLIDDALANPDRLDEAGTVQIGDDPLLQLDIRPAPTIEASMLGFDDPSVAEFEATLAFLAENDGTPAGMLIEAAWLQGEEQTPAVMNLQYRFAWPASDVAVEAPDNAFEWHEGAELGYRMLKPVLWTVTHEPANDQYPEMDLFLGKVDDEVQVIRYADLQGALSAAEWYRASALALARDFGVEPEFVADLTLPGGLEARIFLLVYEEADGQMTFFEQAVVYGGNVAWDINWFSFAGTEEADGEQFLKFVGSFSAAD